MKVRFSYFQLTLVISAVIGLGSLAVTIFFGRNFGIASLVLMCLVYGSIVILKDDIRWHGFMAFVFSLSISSLVLVSSGYILVKYLLDI